ncbi:hypothetical protein JCM5353_008331 [Sporobolomyces roseus]
MIALHVHLNTTRIRQSLLEIYMSLIDQDGSTSPNPIKQEDEGDQDVSGVPQPAQSPTSLLSLPNDVLLLIYREIDVEYGRCINGFHIPFPISTILIDKRIYTLVRSLCFSRLIISKKQLDRRLAGILNDTISINRTRRECLRSLKVDLTNSFYNLVTSTVACLPKLFALSLDISDGINSTAVQALAEVVASKGGLRELQLKSPVIRPIDKFYEHYISEHPEHTIRIAATHGSSLSWIRESENGSLKKTNLYDGGGISGVQINWSNLVSLTLVSSEESLSWVAAILAGLGEAIRADARGLDVDPVALQCLTLDLANMELLSWTGYQELQRDLQFANLKELRFISIDSIPESFAHLELCSVQTLELDGDLRLKDSSTRKSFFALLSALPNLTHLYLYGYAFFSETDESACPLDETKLDENSLYKLYPELCTLICILRSSKVIYVSYGGDDCERQLRWTRSNREEDFKKDCWTLWW